MEKWKTHTAYEMKGGRHVIGMTQFYVCAFETKEKTKSKPKPRTPLSVSTYDVSSCVVLVLKNQHRDDSKKCAAFGMVHFNFANVFFESSADANMTTFLKAFQSIGGILKSNDTLLLLAELYGGLVEDENDVRSKVKTSFKKTMAELGGNGEVEVQEETRHKINGTIASFRQGTGEKLTLCCDSDTSYTRKVVWKKGKVVDTQLDPLGSTILSDSNKKYVVLVDQKDMKRLNKKTNSFQGKLNKILQSKDKGGEIATVLGLHALSQEECTAIEFCPF